MSFHRWRKRPVFVVQVFTFRCVPLTTFGQQNIQDGSWPSKTDFAKAIGHFRCLPSAPSRSCVHVKRLRSEVCEAVRRLRQKGLTAKQVRKMVLPIIEPVNWRAHVPFDSAMFSCLNL